MSSDALGTSARRLINRRSALGLIGAGAAAALVSACSKDSTTATMADTTTTGASSAAGAADDLSIIPEETAGPFPADGSNGPNVLTQSGVVRQDIRKSFGNSTVEAVGLPTEMEFTVVDAAGAPMPGTAIYLWHCDADGRYSVYDSQLTDINYLRGVQEANSAGIVRFTTAYPGCYSGRWPHMHFEVYSSLADATSGSAQPIATSQVALTETTSSAAYRAKSYAASAQALAGVTLATDMVFADGVDHQTPTESGSADSSLTLRLTVAVSA